MLKGLCAASILTAGVLATASSAHATLIAYDGFDYTGNLNGKNSATDVGFGANAWTIVSGQADPVIGTGSLEFTDTNGNELDTEGNKVAPANTSRSTRNFDSTIAAANTTMWISFRINHTGASNTALPTNHAGFSLFSAANGTGNELFLGKPGSATNWGMDTSSAAAAQRTGAVTVTGDRDALLLYKLVYTGTSAAISMWVNPDDLTNESTLGTADATSTETGISNFVSMRVSTGGNATGFQFDEFRIADNFAQVVPVPEPTMLGLGVIGAGMLLHRRRRA
jgi:hypothetical protein